MIFDTDILIWAQRGNDKAAELLDRHPIRKISIISYMEFIQCAQDKHQLSLSKNFFNRFNWEMLPVVSDISNRAAFYIEQFSLSHGLEIDDALVAATAVEHGLPLASANDKHYRMIEELELVKFRP